MGGYDPTRSATGRIRDWVRADITKYSSPTAKMPFAGEIETVDDERWIDQTSACARLRVDHGHLRLLSSAGRVQVVLNQAGEYGVERESLEMEAERRNVKGLGPRLTLALADLRVWLGL